MELEKLLNELDNRSLEEVITSESFRSDLEGIQYDWHPNVRDILKEDLEAYRG